MKEEQLIGVSSGSERNKWFNITESECLDYRRQFGEFGGGVLLDIYQDPDRIYGKLVSQTLAEYKGADIRSHRKIYTLASCVPSRLNIDIGMSFPRFPLN